MGLLKAKKKKTKLRVVSMGGGAEISPERPQYVEKTAPCIGNCPAGADIRSWLVTIAQHEAYGRTTDQAYQVAWETITEKNPSIWMK